VSNAGIGEGGPISEMPVDVVRRMFETNVFSSLALAQHAARKFLESKMRGRIVFVSSMVECLPPMASARIARASMLWKESLPRCAMSSRPAGSRFRRSIPELTTLDSMIGSPDTTYPLARRCCSSHEGKRDPASFAPLLKGQLDPQEMIDKMVEVIGVG